jgi:hypothetical protein
LSSNGKKPTAKRLSQLLVQYRAPTRTVEGKLIFESRERRVVIDAEVEDPDDTIRRILAVADFSTPKTAPLIEIISVAPVVS